MLPIQNVTYTKCYLDKVYYTKLNLYKMLLYENVLYETLLIRRGAGGRDQEVITHKM